MHFASSITRIRVRIVALALGLALTAAIVAACGSSNDNTTSGGAAASTSTAAKSTSTAAASTTKSAGVTDYVEFVGGTAGAADSSQSPIVIGSSTSRAAPTPWGPAPRSAPSSRPTTSTSTPVASAAIRSSSTRASSRRPRSRASSAGRSSPTTRRSTPSASRSRDRGPIHAREHRRCEADHQGRVGQPGRHQEQERVHALRRLGPHPGPWGTFGRDVLEAKTAAVVYPQVPGITGRHRDGEGHGEGGHRGRSASASRPTRPTSSGR